MSKLFILGTGFSAAVLEAMGHKNKLTMGDLGKYVKKYVCKLPGDPKEYERIMSESNDVEMLLTYLYQDMPWKLSEEMYMGKSAFLSLSRLIADYIAKCEEEAFPKDTTPPEWCREFVQHLHDKRAVVATFNYDTVLERLSHHIEIEQEKPEETDRIWNISDFYKAPIAKLAERGGDRFGVGGGTPRETYRLLKLHGSINWHFSGDENAPGQQVYYSDEFYPLLGRDTDKIYLEALQRNKVDLVPLIVPPVAGKSSFYRTTLLRAVWNAFYVAAKQADEIYCIGYSLPVADLSTQIFFSSVLSSAGKKIYIVNLKGDSDHLIDRYEQVLGKCSPIKKYITDEKPVEQMVRDLVT